MQSGKANIVMDGQWGSTGKGKLVGYLALKHDIAAATCDFMANAGHTFVYNNGRKVITCQLPSSLVNDNCLLFINPGAAISLSKLFEEIEKYDVAGRLFIHPHAAIITEEDKEHEARVLQGISSTLKGCGGSLARKVMRVARLAKDEPSLKQFIQDTTNLTHGILRSGGTVLVEGAQGFDLSLNHGFRYPYVTSRDVTTMSILNNAGIPPFYLGDVFGCLRTFPIRVGDMFDKEGTKVGTSGPYYQDQTELTWEEITALSGSDVSLLERTTVTKKVRRIFTFSHTQINRFIDTCAPTKLFVNFINYISANDVGVRTVGELSARSTLWVKDLQDRLNSRYSDLRGLPAPRVSFIGTGDKNQDMIEL